MVADGWKVSLTVLVAKTTKTKKWAEFKPINTLPVYEKMFEVIVTGQLMEQ